MGWSCGSALAVLVFAVVLAALVAPARGECNAPDGFWEQYNAEMKGNHDHHHHHHGHGHGHDHHGHHHDHHHDHHHGGARQAAEPYEHKKTHREGLAVEDYDEVLARIEREAHGGREGELLEEPSWSVEMLVVYATTAVFGFVILLPFWMPLWLAVLSKISGAGRAKPSDPGPSPSAQQGVLLKGWFSEVNAQWPGQAMSLKVKEVLLDKQTKFQHLTVLQSETWGKVLVLDGVVQITERDEMSYQEMLSHLALFSHPKPKRVLVVGGGDGGIVREVAKHGCVEEIVMCEIDEEVIEASKKFFPKQSIALSDPRLKVEACDAVEFCKELARKVKDGETPGFDVAIVDSSDPDGPAEQLFAEPFYADMHALLAHNGVLSTQGESLWLSLDLMAKLRNKCAKPFEFCEYASIQIPTYPCGQIGALVAIKGNDHNGTTPVRRPAKDMRLQFYSPELHSASFVLPAFVRDALGAKSGAESAKPAKKGGKKKD